MQKDTAEAMRPIPLDAVVYRTTRTIKNPIGDGRHNRAEWRPELDKNHIQAGTVFAVDADGNVYDLSRAARFVDTKKAVALREALMNVASAPLIADVSAEVATVDAVAESLGGADVVLNKMCDVLGVTPDKLKAMFAEGSADSTPSPSRTPAKPFIHPFAARAAAPAR